MTELATVATAQPAGEMRRPADGAAPPPPWPEILTRLHERVRHAAARAGVHPAGSRNAKGDEVKAFDLAADDAALAALAGTGLPLVVESEERGAVRLGDGPPRHRVVLDPVDGSDNRARGLPLSAVSCAVLPVDAPLRPERVAAALVGPLERETPLIAVAGNGLRRGGDRLRTSGVRAVGRAMISVELNHHAPAPGLGRLMAAARGVRCYGCASRAISLVAEGLIDAHVDVRRRLTAESYLAAARLVIEAGGCVVGLDGAPLAAPESLTERVGLIAAASRDLALDILGALGDGRDGRR